MTLLNNSDNIRHDLDHMMYHMVSKFYKNIFSYSKIFIFCKNIYILQKYLLLYKMFFILQK